jgi:hypothetical protein
MATFDASKIRACTLEMREKAFDLYADLLPLITTVSTWTLNGLDPALPLPYAVKVQLDSYKAITVQRLKLDDWVTAIQQAQPGDTLTYPPPGALSGQIQFDELSFETIIF